MTSRKPNPMNDYVLISPPTDTVSGMAWSPTANYLACGSWDSQVRVWQVNGDGSSVLQGAQAQEGPILDVAWSTDGSAVFSSGCDNKAYMWDLNANSFTVVGVHDAPIRSCVYEQNLQCLITAGWDATVRFWDLRSEQPICTHQLPERVRAMDCVFPLLVCATTKTKDNKTIVLYDLNSPQAEFGRVASQLKYQTRSLACFPDASGFAQGSIEGRVAIHNIQENRQMGRVNFAFKCHRHSKKIYAVNDISFHPRYGTFATVGADGVVFLWDKTSQQRIKMFKRCPVAINNCAFNSDGTILAYDQGYDWSQGSAHYNQQQQPQVYLHPATDEETMERPKQ